MSKKKRVTIDCSQDGMTQKEFAHQTDINRLMSRYARTGTLPMNPNRGMFADVSGIGSYQESLDFVKQANKDFERLDYNIRRKFNNNPQELIDFLKDENNINEARKLGLVEPERPKKDTAPTEAVESASEGITEEKTS